MVFKVVNIDKESAVEGPPVIYQPAPKPSRTKKYVVIGLFSVSVALLLMITILVGIYIYTEAQKEIIKFSLKLEKGRSQDVTSDVTSNVVLYHVKDGSNEAWIIDDFNTDIKVTKIESGPESSCYITPLNRSTAMEPSKVIKPTDENIREPAQHDSIVYQTTGKPIEDTSFLNKIARSMCQGLPVYWMYPICARAPSQLPDDKMEIISEYPPFYTYFRTEQNGIKYPCINGCCTTVCAFNVEYAWLLTNDRIYCHWITKPCMPGTQNCFYKKYCSPTKGLSCNKSQSQCA